MSTANVTQTGGAATVAVTVSRGLKGDTGATGAPGTTDYNELDNVPSEFPPEAHTHPVSDITPISSGKLVGRHGGGSGAGQEIGLDGGLEFQGANIRREALTGDVTAEAGSNATTIANDVVTNAKLANVPTATIKGRITAGTGDPEDLTPAQAIEVIGAATPASVAAQIEGSAIIPSYEPTVYGKPWGNAGTIEMGSGGPRPTLDGMTGWWTVADRTTVLDIGSAQADDDEAVAKLTPVVGTVDLVATGATVRHAAKDYVELSGSGSGLTANGVLGAAFTVLVAAKRRSYTTAAGFMGSGAATLNFYQAAAGQFYTLGCLNGATYDSQTLPSIALDMTQTFGWRVGTNGKWGVNKGISKSLTGTAPIGSNLQIGYATGLTNRSALNVHEVLVWNRALTNTEYDEAVEYLNRRWRDEKVIVVEGDSVMSDTYSDSVSDGIAADPAWSAVPIFNYATSGDRSDEILDDLQAAVWDIANADTKILITNGGINDVNQSVAVSVALGHLLDMYREARELGWIVVGTVNHENDSWTTAQDALNRGLNWMIRQNTIAQHMIPMDTLFQSPHVPAKFHDNVHLSQEGVDDVVAWLLTNVLPAYS